MIRTLATLAAVTAWLGGVSAVAVTAATETLPVALSPAHTLAHTRIACGVDRFDTAEQTLVFRGVDLSDTALRCVLDGVGAPPYVATDIVRTLKPLETSTARWDTATATWFRDPESGLDVTIRMTGAAS